LPSLLRQPDGIAALAHAQVEREPWLEPADLLDQELVESFCPEERRASIALIPVVCFHPIILRRAGLAMKRLGGSARSSSPLIAAWRHRAARPVRRPRPFVGSRLRPAPPDLALSGAG